MRDVQSCTLDLHTRQCKVWRGAATQLLGSRCRQPVCSYGTGRGWEARVAPLWQSAAAGEVYTVPDKCRIIP